MIGPVPSPAIACRRGCFPCSIYGDGAATLIDPFAEVREFCAKVKGRVGDKRKLLTEKRNSARRAVLVFAVLAVIVLLAMIVTQSASVGMILPLIAFGGLAIWKKVALSGIDAELLNYGGGPALAPVTVKAATPVALTPAPQSTEAVAAKPQPAVTPAQETPEPVAVKSRSAGENAEPVEIVRQPLPNRGKAGSPRIGSCSPGLRSGLVLLFVVAQAVIRNQNEKSASDDRSRPRAQKENANDAKAGQMTYSTGCSTTGNCDARATPRRVGQGRRHV